MRAALANLTSGAQQGAGTITMQVARNFFLTRERTLTRKLREVLLAYKIENSLSKDEILELYVNQIFLGQRAYGFAAAAQIYDPNDLLQATPGEPGVPVVLPGYPSETASGGVKAPQYFAPGVAGDHGEPIAQYIRIGDFLFPTNLPANAHGNGYADPNLLVPAAIGYVESDAGAFDVRHGNNAVDLAVAYGLVPRLEPFLQMSADPRLAGL